jgi:transposase InsO family protein
MYLCSILDGASRAIVHWEIREQMTEADVECILVRAQEAHPNERPRIISDNGPRGQDGEARVGAARLRRKRGRSMTDIVRREAEFPLCLFTGNDQRGFILQPSDAT